MSFLTRLLTLLLAIWAVLRVLRFLFLARRAGGQAGVDPRRQAPPFSREPREPLSRGKMVLDRVCGTHIPQDRALTLTERGETLYFCGADCRDAHQRGQGASG